jgi:hypothetical protein
MAAWPVPQQDLPDAERRRILVIGVGYPYLGRNPAGTNPAQRYYLAVVRFDMTKA